MSVLSEPKLGGQDSALGFHHGNHIIEKGSGPRLPQALTGPLVWAGGDFLNQSTYTLRLGQHDLKEIKQAVQDLNGNVAAFLLVKCA